MKKIWQLAAPAVPILMLLLVYAGDTLRMALVSVLVFFLLMALLAASSISDETGQPLVDTDFGLGFAKGRIATWSRIAGAGGLAMLALLFSGRRYQGMVVLSPETQGAYIAGGVAVLALLLLLVKPPKPVLSLIVLLIAGLAIRALWFPTWELNPAKRDMLPLVVSAIETFLSFENPYGFHHMQRGSEVPLTYPPGLWLMHVPAYLAGLDIRWTAWLSDGVIVACIGGFALRSRSAMTGPVFVALAVYLFLPDIHWNGIYAEPHADWAVLSILTYCVLTKRPYIGGLVMGLALTTRPFNLVLIPFFLIWLIRRFGPRKAWEAMLITSTLTAAMYLPFILWDPDAFYAGTVRWLLEYGVAHRSWFHGKMSFSGPLYQLRMEHLLAPAQIAVLVISTALAVWKLRSTRHLLVFWMVVYGLFVAFNSIVWMSFWVGCCLLAMFLLAAVGDPETRLPNSSVRHRVPFLKKRLIAEIGLAVGIAVSAAVILYLLHRHFDDSGLDDAWAYVSDALEPGDFVVDNGGYRKAILKTPYLLSKADLPKRAKTGPTPFQAMIPRRHFVEPGASERVFLVDRFGLSAGHLSAYLGTRETSKGPYHLRETRTFGNYETKALEKRPGVHQIGRLSAAADTLAVSANAAGTTQKGTFEKDKWIFGSGPVKGAPLRLKPCTINRSTTNMISVKPGVHTAYRFTAPQDAEWITVFGGQPDKTAFWRKTPMHLSIRSNDTEIGTVVFPNLGGMRGATFEVPKGSRDVTFELETGDSPPKGFCLDALFLGSRP